MNELSDRLIHLRTNLGFNRKEFAELIDMPQSSYSHLEKGRKPNNLKRLSSSIAEKFNVNEDWLLYGKGEMIKSESTTEKDDSEKTFTIKESDIPLLFELFQLFNHVRQFDKKTQEKY